MERQFSIKKALVMLAVSFLLFRHPLMAQESRIKTSKVSDNIYMLEAGAPGNIGVFFGEDGVILIDDQFAPLTDEIVIAIGKITHQKIRFLLNTHAHPDHVGGNENLGELGILIIGQDNVRAHMVQGIFGGSPYPDKALPIITFNDTVTFHMNGEEVKAFKVANAHTDSDTIIHFLGSDVIHTGDVFRTTTYPFIDTDNGGNFLGQIKVLEQLLALAGPKTMFIPGHGKVSTKEGVKEFYLMLVTVKRRVEELIRQGKTLKEVLQAQVTADYDERWDIKPSDMEHYGKVPFIEMVYQQLRAH
jgi:glyoxylase-like metal-dependent hydrolase (beta-lactamase superfamily II)